MDSLYPQDPEPSSQGLIPTGPCRTHTPNSLPSAKRFPCFQMNSASVTQHDHPALHHSETHMRGAEPPNLELCPGSTGSRQAGCLASEASRTRASLLRNTWSPVDTRWRPSKEANNQRAPSFSFTFLFPWACSCCADFKCQESPMWSDFSFLFPLPSQHIHTCTHAQARTHMHACTLLPLGLKQPR